MVYLGPLSDDRGLYESLKPEDREWLELMADVLPRHMPIKGTENWFIYGPPDPWIMQETVRG